MINKKMLDALNKQINAEMYSSYLYLAMAADFADKNFPGFAQWMQVQAREEDAHAMKIFCFIQERGGRVTLKAIDAPPAKWTSPLKAFQDAYAHEQKVTGMIHDLVMLARAEKDLASEIFLQWFVNEQVEEEASADEIVKRLEMIKDAPQGLVMLDAKLGARGAS